MDNLEEVDIYNIPEIRLDKEPRPQQIEILDFIIDSIKSNNKYICINAATGTGKSYISILFMDWYKNNYDRNATFDVLTNSKILTAQYQNDFDFMNNLSGVDSYQCKNREGCSCAVAKEMNAALKKESCDGCPYDIAKLKFESGDVALTNFHLFNTYRLLLPEFAWKRRSSVLIIDESHDFESVFCDFISIKINKKVLEKSGFDYVEVSQAIDVFGKQPENLSIEEFIRIVQYEFMPIVKSVMSRLVQEAKDDNEKSMKHAQNLGNNILKWDKLISSYKENPKNFILESEYIFKHDPISGENTDRYINMSVNPVWMPEDIMKIWNSYDYVIFLSATILNKEVFCEMNHLDVDITTYIDVPTPFPIENRQIFYFENSSKMSYNILDQSFEENKMLLNKIFKKHKNDKGLVHTHTYNIQEKVVRHFELTKHNDRILAHGTGNRNEILDIHFNSDNPTVLVSPSFTEGVSLDDDYCRFVVITKVNYGSLGSKRIRRRMEEKPEVYQLETVRKLIQSAGRGVRHMEDKCITYVIDKAFGDILKYSKKFFPKYFLDSIIYVK